MDCWELLLVTIMRCYFDQQIFMMQPNGGISRYFFELLRRLGAIEDTYPTLFAGLYLSELPLNSLQHCRVIGLPRRFRMGPAWPLAVRTCAAANRALLNSLSPDIYHPTYYRFAEQPSGTRLVVTVYDMIHEKFPEIFPLDDTAAIKRKACAAADAIICISHSTRKDLLGYYPEYEAKTSVVHLSAATSFGMNNDVPTEPTKERPYALFVGVRRGYKGFDVTLEAWERLLKMIPDLRLICVGGGAFNSQETAEIHRRHLDKNIVQTSASDTELAKLYGNAALFIYPSRYEGFGLPVLEAMACGCPVICCRSSSLPEVGGKAASYFEPSEAAELASKVEAIMVSPSRRKEMVQSGYEQHKRFSWERCARETAEAYRNIHIR